MTAAMNASLNLSIPDGWVPEFAKHGKNAFVIDTLQDAHSVEEKDKFEAKRLYELLENELIPMYYESPAGWTKMVKTSMKDVLPYFDSSRMAHEYYEKMYLS
jgi:starch phosphorylase